MTTPTVVLTNLLNTMWHHANQCRRFEALAADAWYANDHTALRRHRAELKLQTEARDATARKIGELIFEHAEDFDLALTPRIREGHGE